MLRDHRYSDLSMVMDSGGAIHAAAVINGGIVYFTNVTGTWVQMPLSAPLEEDEVVGGPSIGIDASGRLAVAFHRGKCGSMSCTPFEVFLVTNDSGGWSEERPIAGGDSPSLQLQDGVIHLTYKVSEGANDVACPAPRADSIHDQCWRRLAGHAGFNTWR